MPSRTALAIDDYQPSRYAHSRVLKQAGFNVYEAGDGHTGLVLAQRHIPNIVLLDLNLPDIHGFEVCARLKASELTRHIPVIHVTATSRGERYRREAISAGADLFLEEPVSAEELLRAVNGLVDRRAAPAASSRVLLLSPYADECDLYGEALKAAGYQIACGNPENGESLVRTVAPDIVVTRIRPGDSGLRLARSLQDNPETAHIPVVIITTYPDVGRRAQAEAIGVAEYFVLPVWPDQLIDAIGRLVSKNPR